MSRPFTSDITCWPSVYEPEKGRPASLSALVRRIRDPKPSPAKDATGRWAAASFRGHYRSLANFISAEAIVLDVDSGVDHQRFVLEPFLGITMWCHTTWTPGRWRIVVPLDTAVDVYEFPRVHRALLTMAECGGLFCERGQSAAQAYALPCTGGAPYQWAELDGPYFDVETALKQFPEAEPELEPHRSHGPIDASYASRLYRAKQYLACIPEAVAGRGGHKATFGAACALVRGFGLAEKDAMTLLVDDYNSRCDPPWSLTELRHKVKQAAAKGQMAPGKLAEKTG
jgi:hypothetical protein